MKKKACIAIVSATILLSGCDTVRETFGLTHENPDEFAVSQNPDLRIPPAFHLVPPGAKGQGTYALSASQKAEKLIGGKGITAKTASSERALLAQASAS